MEQQEQVDGACKAVRTLFTGKVKTVFPTDKGMGIAVSNRTLCGADMRKLEATTKRFGCHYSIAPAVSTVDATFVIMIVPAPVTA